MKITTLISVLFFSMSSYGRVFYVSNSGNNSNTGLSEAQAWATISKINSFTFSANDTIAFQRGGTFSGTLRVSRNNLTFISYGVGSLPIITGQVQLTAWQQTGTNKYRCAVSADSTLNLLTISGVPKQFAQDSLGFKRFQSNGTTNSIIYPHSGNWTGRTMIMKTDEWTIQKVRIISDVSNVLTFAKIFALVNGGNVPFATIKNNFGFFLSNDTTFLDIPGEWTYDYNSQFVHVYSTSAPTNVYIAGLDTLMTMASRQNIVVKGIRFRYGNLYGIYASFATNVTIDSCQFEYMGAQAFGAYRITNLTFQNSTVDQCLQTGIYVQDVTAPYVNVNILNNTITNVGTLFGMGSFWQNPDYSALGVSAFTGLKVLYNTVSNAGDAGIKWGGDIAEIAYNVVSYVCLLTADRGCIYNFVDIDAFDTHYRRLLHHNFCSYAFGNLQGTPQETSANPTIRAIGIYLDGRNDGDSVYYNVIYNIPGGAFSFNIDTNVVCYGNLVVLTDSSSRYAKSMGIRVQQLRNYPIRFFEFFGNIVFASSSSQKQLQYTAATQSPASIINNFKAIGTINNNFYNLPLIANYQTEANTPYGLGNYTHAQYTTTFGFGVNDIQLPSYNLSQCLFLRNPTNATTVTPISKVWADAYGTIYTTNVTLQPYTAKLLFPTAVTPIVVTIDSNPVITLPVNFTTISGSAVGGSGITYQWVKLTGTGGTITSPTSASTTVTGLVAGTYTYQLIATNSLLQKDTGYATVTVNPAPPPANVPPVVTITPNTLQITLPTNSVTLNGSATDSDGTVVSYQWTKVSGTGGTIATPTTATTDVTGLTAGTYIFSLTATDNVGATGSTTVQVQVNPQPPTTTPVRGRFKKG